MNSYNTVKGECVIYEVEFSTKWAVNKYQFTPEDRLQMTHQEVDHNTDEPPDVVSFGTIEIHLWQNGREKFWQYSLSIDGERTFYSQHYKEEEYEKAEFDAFKHIQEHAIHDFSMAMRDGTTPKIKACESKRL